MAVQVGDVIHIDYMNGEPEYTGREGTVRKIDDMGQIHGTWGGLALHEGEDSFTILDSASPQQQLKKNLN